MLKMTSRSPMRAARRSFLSIFTFAAIAIVAYAGGCGGTHTNLDPGDDTGDGAPGSSSGSGSGSGSSSSSGTGGSSGSPFGGGSDAGNTPTCGGGSTGWICQVDSSCGTKPTTLSGKVFDPAGANPLYNVVVFIPNVVSQLPAIDPGTHSCNTCDVSIGDYVVATTTAADGTFTLSGVPNGKQVPVTVQIGKWRRTTYVDINNACAANTVANGTLHLPGKQADGDMPQMAVLTGGCDDLGCFLTGMGIDPSEFTAPHKGGRVDVYQGGGLAGNGATLSNGTAGNCTNSSCPLWAGKSSFEYYDMALFSCECGENNNTKPAAGMTALADWLNEGGKVFASHYQYTWFKNNPTAAFKGVANWVTSGAANPSTATEDIDNTFPKGKTFVTWLGGVGALNSAGPPPTIDLSVVATSVSTVNMTSPQNTTRWIYDPNNSNDVKYMTFGTPIGGLPPSADAGAEQTGPLYCGKAVFTDLHTSASLLSTVSSIPSGCGGNSGKLSAQQKALEFLFFDLSACVSNDSDAPPPPPPSPK
jgi:hypothetical protein